MKTIGIVVAVSLMFIGTVGCKKKQDEKKSAPGPMAAMATDPGTMTPEKRPVATPEKRPVVAAPAVPVDKEAVPEGVLSEVTGTVEIRRAGTQEFKAAAKDAKVFAKDSLRAGKDGEAVVALWDNSSIELTPESAVTLNGSADIKNPSPSVTVMAGAARFDINERTDGQGPFAVYTPSAAVAVQGTVLAVGVGLSGSSRVAVEEGKVAVTPVVKVDAKPLALLAGKVVIVPMGKIAAKPAAYSTEKAGWDEWLETEDTKAVQTGAELAKTHADQVEALAKDSETLEGAEDQENTETEKLQAQAAAAEKAKKLAAYKKLQPLIAQRLVNQSAMYAQHRFVNGRAMAHAYLLELMSARIHAGVYKVKNPAINAAVLKEHNRIQRRRARWELRRLKRRIKRRKRAKRLRRAYYRHHYQGRAYATKHKIAVPKFYQQMKLRKKMRRRRAVIRGWKRPVYRRPVYRGKYRKAATAQMMRRNRAWYRNAKWKQHRQKRRARAKAKRALWRKAVIKRRVKRWKKRPAYHKAWRVKRRQWRRKHLRRGMRPGLRGMRPGLRGMHPKHMGMGMHPKHMGMGMHPKHMGMGMHPKHMGMGMRPKHMGMGMGRFSMRKHGMLTPMERRKLRRKIRKKIRKMKRRGMQ